MSDEHRDDERMRELLGAPRPVSVPTFESLRRTPSGSARRAVAVTLVTVLVAVAALYAGRELSAFKQQQAPPTSGVAAPSATATPKVTLPQPIPQVVTRTSPAAQVAWVSTSMLNAAATERLTTLVGLDPTGKVVGRIDGAKDPFVYRAFRSADGSQILTVGDTAITAYSALDGTVQRTYPRNPGDGVVDAAFSPDGRWFALIGSGAYVQVIDLRTGLTQTTPLGRDPNAHTPGLTVAPGFTGLIWSTLVFAADSKRLYTIVDWAGPLRVTTFDVTTTGLVQGATAVDGVGGKTFPGCGGPGLAAKVVGGGQTLVLFCHVDGSIEFIDLPSLTAVTTIHAEQKNPFWLSPIFTPDGQLLYLHQQPAFGDFMQVVDLRSHALLGPVPTPTKTEQPGPFSWLFGTAYAGGVASTVPVSPDGLKVYSAATGAIAVLRVPDLKPLARLADGYSLNEVWISGDGKTVYATDGGKGVLVMREDGSAPPSIITLPLEIGGFIASEHG